MLQYILKLGLPATSSTLIFLIISIPIYYAVRALIDPLRRIPGPFLARFTRFWEIKTVAAGRFEHVNRELHDRYGPIVRLGPNRFSISDPAAIEDIYRHGSKFAKSGYYDGFPIDQGDGKPVVPKYRDVFTQPHSGLHTASRRKFANMYSMSALVSYEPYVDKVNLQYQERLRGFCGTAKSLDLCTWMEFYALDVIGEISFGRDLGMLAAGLDHDHILQGTKDGNMIAAKVGLAPKPIRDAIKFLNRRVPALKLFGYGAAPTQAVIREIGKRQQGASFSDREDFMTKTLKLAKEGKLDPPEILQPVGMNVGAGSDTTGISLTATIYYLMKHPASLARLREELAEAERQGQISEPIKFSEAQKLLYFNAVLKEALRMHPAVGTILARVVPEGGMTVAGHFLPPGTEIGANAWVSHQNTDVFGSDAASFSPERWLESPERSAAMDRHLLSFGAGARTCLGKNISMLEMSKLVPTLVREFDFEFADKSNPVWTTESGWFVWQAVDVKVRERKSTA